MDKGGRLRHLKEWKFFKDPENNIRKIVNVLKLLIFDITLSEKNLKPQRIENKNWEKWLEKNWLDELSSIKHYFYQN